MRYWIYWNDLVQGPFELDELSTLKALSEDLPVCLEDRTDWIPACRVADLAPIIEERRSARMPPPPPPPPPTGRPAADPLQGEFFTEAPNQKWLFPDNDPSKGPFAFSSTQMEMKTVFPEVSFTAPIRFYGGSAASATGTATLVRPVLAPPEPREVFHPASLDVFASKESPVPELRDDPLDMPSDNRIPLEIYPDRPETIHDAPSELPPLSVESSPDYATLRLAGWGAGILLVLLLIGSVTYRWFDFSTSRAAINEAKKRALATKSLILTESQKTTGVPEKIAEPVNHRQDAIALVMNYAIPKINQTVGERAQIMGEGMPGDKKAVWNAQQMKGALYRVSLIFPAKQSGVLAHAYSFLADIGHQTVSTADAATETQFLKAKKKLSHHQTASGTTSTSGADFGHSAAIPTVAASSNPGASAAAAASVAPANAGDAWKNREQDAKDLVMNKKIPKINQTVGDRAQAMVDQSDGQTKALWDALQIKGSLYRVSLILSSTRPGAAAAGQLYSFAVDLKTHRVSTDDAQTASHFLKAKKKLSHHQTASGMASTPGADSGHSAAVPGVAALSKPGAAAAAARAAPANAGDAWKSREQDAKDLVMNKQIPKINQTVGQRAQALVDQSNGQTKATWDAVQIKDSLYHVSLILGNRLYPFLVDLKNNTVSTDDAQTSSQFLKAKKKLAATPGAAAANLTAAAIPGMAQTQSPETAAIAVPAADEKSDPWKDRFKEAIALTTNKKIGTTKQTVGERAVVMLEGMHDKELLYAADTGQRLYLPDKIAWSALRESGPVYRVYLGFSADQANGERTQTQSYQFQTNLELHIVVSDDAASVADFLNAQTVLVHNRDPRAADIQNILSAVDALNKQLMRAIIVKDNRKNRLEEKNIAAAIKAVMQRFQRAVIYFRTKYPDTMLQNIAQAYSFSKLLKDHV